MGTKSSLCCNYRLTSLWKKSLKKQKKKKKKRAYETAEHMIVIDYITKPPEKQKNMMTNILDVTNIITFLS